MKIGDLFGHLGNLGILAGLVFVGLQLAQDRELKRIEMVSRSMTDLYERSISAMGETPYAAITKAAMDSENMTPEEAYIYTSYLDVVMIGWDRRSILARQGTFDSDWHQNVGIPMEFRTRPGIAWLERELERPGIEGWYPPDMIARLRQLITKPGVTEELRLELEFVQGAGKQSSSEEQNNDDA